MKRKYSDLVSAMNGSLNGSTTYRGKYGFVTRNKVTPFNPNTAKQVNYRGIFSGLSQAWRVLDQDMRDSWILWASTHPFTDVFGDTYYLSGISAFIKLNQVKQSVQPGSSTMVYAPADHTTVLTTFNGFYVNSALGGNIHVHCLADGDVNTYYQIWGSGELSAGISNTRKYERLLYVMPPIFHTGETSFTGSYNSVFGVVTSGKTYSMRIVAVDAISYATTEVFTSKVISL